VSTSITFLSTDGRDPHAVILDLIAAISPNVSDGLYGGQMVRTFIRDRTAAGVDVDGNPFAEYSKGYAKAKERKGRNSNPVDLFSAQQHDHMLNGILVKSGSQEAVEGSFAEGNLELIKDFRVGIYSEELAQRAIYNNEGTSRGMPVRKAFAVNPGEVSQIEQAIGQRCEIRAQAATRR